MELLTDVIDVIRAAGDSTLHIIYSDSKKSPAAKKKADQFEVEPAGLEGDEYVQFCLDFARTHQVTLFIPSRYNALISANRARFEKQRTRLLVTASPETLQTIGHKTDLYQVLGAETVPTPEWHIVNTLAELETAYADLSSRHKRVCFKPARGVFAHGFREIVSDGSFYRRVMKSGPWTASSTMGMDEVRLCFGQQKRFDDLIVMQFLDGSERSVDCLAQNGQLVSSIIRLKGKNDTQTIESNPGIEAVIRNITAKLSLHGVFNVQFKDHGGEHYLLEINSRMSGGLHKACFATNFMLPYWAIRLALGTVDIADVPKPQTGKRIRKVTQFVVE